MQRILAYEEAASRGNPILQNKMRRKRGADVRPHFEPTRMALHEE